MQAALMLRSKSRIRGKLRNGRMELPIPSNVATREIPPWPQFRPNFRPQFPPESWVRFSRVKEWLFTYYNKNIVDERMRCFLIRTWVEGSLGSFDLDNFASFLWENLNFSPPWRSFHEKLKRHIHKACKTAQFD